MKHLHWKRAAWFSAGIVILAGAIVFVRILLAIQEQSTVDESRPAEVIVVMGAAEYRGKPSPVLRARLDHGLALYRLRLAPRILTTGGAGGDPEFTESGVGRAYLIGQGVPPEAIIVEPEAGSTAHSAVAIAEIMRRMNLTTCVVVSDGYHIYRIKRMLEQRGIVVYGSPRPHGPEDLWLYARQAAGYLLWSAGIVI